jgi:hypothetical protein
MIKKMSNVKISKMQFFQSKIKEFRKELLYVVLKR